MDIMKAYDYNLESSTQDLDKWVDEVVDDFFKRTGHDMTEDEMKVLRSALGYRLSTHKLGDKFGGSVFDDIIGVYNVTDSENGKEYIIEINSKPAHVLNRTTGRPGYSCEQIDQHYWLGPFHDIALRNATAYFYEDKPFKGLQWIGRLNLRWCIDDKGDFNIGVDPNIYPMMVADRDDLFLHQVIWEILRDSEFLNYRHALTPYIYKGHSDTTPSGNVRLPFKGLKFYSDGYLR